LTSSREQNVVEEEDEAEYEDSSLMLRLLASELEEQCFENCRKINRKHISYGAILVSKLFMKFKFKFLK
jgi:hypothetical protein